MIDGKNKSEIRCRSNELRGASNKSLTSSTHADKPAFQSQYCYAMKQVREMKNTWLDTAMQIIAQRARRTKIRGIWIGSVESSIKFLSARLYKNHFQNDGDYQTKAPCNE